MTSRATTTWFATTNTANKNLNQALSLCLVSLSAVMQTHTILMLVVVLLFFSLIQTCLGTGSIFVEIETKRERCFLEDIPTATPIRARYSLFESDATHLQRMMQAQQEIWMHRPGAKNKTEEKTPLSGVTLHVWIEDPNGKSVAENTEGQDGVLLFTSRVSGEHKVCFEAKQEKGSSWFGSRNTYKLHVDLDSGALANDYDEVAKLEHLSALEVQVRKANDLIQQIRREQGYQQSREMLFRTISDSTNSSVTFWALIQFILLAGCCFWQYWSLRRFFKRKKFF